jgi:hypothetical protein
MRVKVNDGYRAVDFVQRAKNGQNLERLTLSMDKETLDISGLHPYNCMISTKAE